ncbi:unnamed protein product [Globisporangium polare]
MSEAPAVIPPSFRAYQYEQCGDPFEQIKLRTGIRQPSLQPHDVRIQVISAALNPVDYKLVEAPRHAQLGRKPSPEQPFTVGFDLAGVVVETGQSVSDFQRGDHVFAMMPWLKFGSFAEYAVVNEEYVALKPQELSFDEAAGVPLASLTSFQALFEHAKLQRGERVLVLGGSSATGVYAIQLAKAVGAYVITTTSFRNTNFVESLDADQVIDYTQEKWVDALESHSVDVVYDCGMEPNAWNEDAQTVLKRQTGRFVSLLPSPANKQLESKSGAKNLGQIIVNPTAAHLRVIAKYFDESSLVAPVDSVYEFEELFDMIRKLKTGRVRGKLILHVHPPPSPHSEVDQ